MSRKRKEIPWLDTRGEVYYAFWYEPATKEVKRFSLRTSDPREAQSAFAAFLIGGGTEHHTGRAAELSTSAALDHYYREHVAPNVVDKKRQKDAITHLKAHFSDKPIGSVDIPASRRYADARRAGIIGGGARRHDGRGSDSTIRRELNVLMAAANHARRWKRLDTLPSLEMPAEKRLGQDDEAPYYTPDELDALRMAADGELAWFLDLAYWTGARRRSIEDLDRSQVKMDLGRVLLQKPGKVATGKRQPIVPIFKPMIPALTALLERDRPKRLFDTADFYRPYHQLCVSVGLAGKAHPHLLRHTRATHLLQAGKPLYAVARLLGDTVATVERVYGHHSVGHIHADLEEELV